MKAVFRHRVAARPQRGAALYVSLIILILLSLLGVMTANNAIVENKLAGAIRNKQLARIAAESAISEAKVKISEVIAAHGAPQVCSQLNCLVRGSFVYADTRDFMTSDQAVAAMNAYRFDYTTLTGDDESARLIASPGYVIEDLGTQPIEPPPGLTSPPPAPPALQRIFRITALGVGAAREFNHVVEDVLVVSN